MLVVFGRVSAQTWEWSMRVQVRYTVSPCSEESIDIARINIGTKSFFVDDARNIAKNEFYVWIGGTDWASLRNQTMTVAVKGTCLDGFATAPAYSFSDEYCDRDVFQGSQTSQTQGQNVRSTVYVSFDFYGKLVAKAQPSCGQVNLSTICTSTGTYKWEASPNGVDGWRVIPRTTGSFTLIPEDLSALNLNPYDPVYVKVTDPGVPQRTLPSPTVFHLNAPPPTVSLVSETQPVCHGNTNGSVTLNVSNSYVDRFYMNCFNDDNHIYDTTVSVLGNGNVKVPWLRAGNWRFQVVNNSADGNSGACSATYNHKLGEPDLVTVGITPTLHNGYAISCKNGTDGSATMTGSGGSGVFKDYNWSTGAATATVTGLGAGTYTASLRDSKGCFAGNTVVLSEPTALQASASAPQKYPGYSVTCHDKADGSATASGTGGIAGTYTYAWSTGSTNATITGLGAGTYTVTVKDGNGCTAPASVVLKAPVPIDFTIDEVVPLTCAGDRNARLEAKPVLSTIIGTPAYSWSSGETSALVENKAAGAYTITVSDDHCSTVKAKTLVDPPGYTVSLSAGSDYNGSVIKCHGEDNGKLVAGVKNASGAVAAPQGYAWFRNDQPVGEGTTLSSFDNLDRGTYKVVITYNTSCKAEAQYILSDPDAVVATAVATSSYHNQAISCYNAADGNIKATVTGGTGAYTYQWNTGSTEALLTGLRAGTYTVTARDANGCAGNSEITLANPTIVDASIEDVSDYSGYGVSCAGATDGTMTAVGSGGTGVYTYSWDNGKTSALIGNLGGGVYTVTVSDNNGCKAVANETITSPSGLVFGVESYRDIACFGGNDGVIRLKASGGVGDYTYSRDNGANWQQDVEFGMLPIGSYTLRVRDGNNCQATVMKNLAQPEKLELSFTAVDPAFCADPRGGATAQVKGGVTDYTYSWTNAGGNVMSTDARLSNVLGGVYTVTVHDAHNCPVAGNVGITSTDGAKANYTAISALCHDSADGSAALTITEGDGPFVIKWPDGQSTLQGTNLKGGDYTVSITDAHACTVVKQVTVPAPLALTLNVPSSTPPTCNGDCDGSLTLQAGGGVGAYRYSWNGQTGATQNNLCHGTYNVVLTDDNGCRLDQQVTLTEPEVLTVSMRGSTLPTCTDGCNGRLEAIASGGNGGYSYSWDGGVAGVSISGLCPGQYSVMVTDTKGCAGSNILTLANTPPLAVSLGGGVTLCVGQTYTLDAGTGWTKVKWGGSGAVAGTTQQLTVKDPGTYWVEVLDAKGCVGRDTFLLETSYDLLQASFMIPKEAIVGDTVAMIDVSWPLPELVDWSFPLEMKQVSVMGDVVFGQFNATGTYTVGLSARLGECRDYIEKSITIIQGSEDETGGRLGYEEYIKTFGLYANPNDGSFDVIVDLADKDDIMLSIWNGQTGALVGKVSEKGNASYNVHVDLRPLSAGAYVLRLDHAKGSNYIRFLVR